MGYNVISMKIKQISVFLEDSIKSLGDLAKLAAREGINVKAISFTESKDISILRLIVNNHEKAIKVFNDANFTTRVSDVAAVEINDTPGGFAGIMELFEKTGVAVENLYTACLNREGKAILIFKLRNHQEGLKILRENGLSLIENI